MHVNVPNNTAANTKQATPAPEPSSTTTGTGENDYFTAATGIVGIAAKLFSNKGAWGDAGAAEEHAFASPLAERAARGLGLLTPQQQKSVSEQLDQYALSLSTQLDPNQIKLDLQEQLQQQGYDQETVEAVLNEMFNGKSGSSGLEAGLNNKNPQTGLNPAEALQSSLLTDYKNTLVGVYTGELTQEQAKAKIKDFSSAASKKIETFKRSLQELAQEKAEYKKGELDEKATSREVDTLLAASPEEEEDENQTTASAIFGADRIYGTSLT